MLMHSEVSFAIRRFLIEQAIKSFPHLLSDHCTRELLITIYHRQKHVEKRFEEELLDKFEYGTGEVYEDRNMRIVHKTFLKAGTKQRVNPSSSERSAALTSRLQAE